MSLELLLAMLCLVGVAKSDRRHRFITLPVQITMCGDKFRYAFFGGPLYSLLASQGAPRS
jgi:hypothetical protein